MSSKVIWREQLKASLASKVYLFPSAALAEYNKLGGLRNRNLLFHSSGGYVPQIKSVLRAMLPLSPEERILPCPFQLLRRPLAFLYLQAHHSHLCLCYPLSLVFTWCCPLCVSVSPCEGASHIRLKTHPTPVGPHLN